MAEMTRHLLRKTHKEEDHDERQHVQTGVEAECANDTHLLKHGRERDRQDGGVEQTRRDGPCHTLFTVRQREHFGTVSERDRSFTWRVECAKQVDKECDEAEVSLVVAWNQRAQAGGEQRPSHLGERE